VELLPWLGNALSGNQVDLDEHLVLCRRLAALLCYVNYHCVCCQSRLLAYNQKDEVRVVTIKALFCKCSMPATVSALLKMRLLSVSKNRPMLDPFVDCVYFMLSKHNSTFSLVK